MWLCEEDCSFRILDILRFRRDSTAKRTAARDFAVISCRLSGKATFWDGDTPVPASPQDFLLIPAGIAYRQEDSDEEVICIHLALEGLTVRRILSFHCISPHLQQCFITLHTLWQSREQGYLLRCRSLIYDILFELVRLSGDGEIERARPIIAPAVDYIRAHYLDKDFSLSRAIAAAFISPAYFRRVFKTVYGVTPSLFVNRMRADLAKLLLADHSRTLPDISDACGFLNQKYFFAVFKKIVGTTPSAWRRAHT